jgi:hypothetical protein
VPVVEHGIAQREDAGRRKAAVSDQQGGRGGRRSAATRPGEPDPVRVEAVAGGVGAQVLVREEAVLGLARRPGLGGEAVVDGGQDGVRVNTVAPALTVPDDVAPRYQGLIDRFNERRAVKSHATPDDVAAAVAFLASADARMITGVILPVDGGITAASGQPPLF